MPDNKVDQLYDALNKDGLKMGRDQFKRSMEDPNHRKGLYDAMRKDGYKGDYESFERSLGYGGSNEPRNAGSERGTTPRPAASNAPSSPSTPGEVPNAVRQQDAAARGSSPSGGGVRSRESAPESNNILNPNIEWPPTLDGEVLGYALPNVPDLTQNIPGQQPQQKPQEPAKPQQKPQEPAKPEPTSNPSGAKDAGRLGAAAGGDWNPHVVVGDLTPVYPRKTDENGNQYTVAAHGNYVYRLYDDKSVAKFDGKTGNIVSFTHPNGDTQVYDENGTSRMIESFHVPHLGDEANLVYWGHNPNKAWPVQNREMWLYGRQNGSSLPHVSNNYASMSSGELHSELRRIEQMPVTPENASLYRDALFELLAKEYGFSNYAEAKRNPGRFDYERLKDYVASEYPCAYTQAMLNGTLQVPDHILSSGIFSGRISQMADQKSRDFLANTHQEGSYYVNRVLGGEGSDLYNTFITMCLAKAKATGVGVDTIIRSEMALLNYNFDDKVEADVNRRLDESLESIPEWLKFANYGLGKGIIGGVTQWALGNLMNPNDYRFHQMQMQRYGGQLGGWEEFGADVLGLASDAPLYSLTGGGIGSLMGEGALRVAGGRILHSAATMGTIGLLGQGVSDLQRGEFSGVDAWLSTGTRSIIGGALLGVGGEAARAIAVRPTNLGRVLLNKVSSYGTETLAFTLPDWVEAVYSGHTAENEPLSWEYMYTSALKNLGIVVSLKGRHNFEGWKPTISSSQLSQLQQSYPEFYDAVVHNLDRIAHGQPIDPLEGRALEQANQLNVDMSTHGKGVTWDAYRNAMHCCGYEVAVPAASSVRVNGTTVQVLDAGGNVITEKRCSGTRAAKDEAAALEKSIEHGEEARNGMRYMAGRNAMVQYEACAELADRYSENKEWRKRDEYGVFMVDENGDYIADENYRCTTPDDISERVAKAQNTPAEDRTPEQRQLLLEYEQLCREVASKIPDADALAQQVCEQYGITIEQLQAAAMKDPKSRDSRSAATKAMATYNNLLSRGALSLRPVGEVVLKRGNGTEVVQVYNEANLRNSQDIFFYRDGEGRMQTLSTQDVKSYSPITDARQQRFDVSDRNAAASQANAMQGLEQYYKTADRSRLDADINVILDRYNLDLDENENVIPRGEAENVQDGETYEKDMMVLSTLLRVRNWRRGQEDVGESDVQKAQSFVDANFKDDDPFVSKSDVAAYLIEHPERLQEVLATADEMKAHIKELMSEGKLKPGDASTRLSQYITEPEKSMEEVDQYAESLSVEESSGEGNPDEDIVKAHIDKAEADKAEAEQSLQELQAQVQELQKEIAELNRRGASKEEINEKVASLQECLNQIELIKDGLDIDNENIARYNEMISKLEEGSGENEADVALPAEAPEQGGGTDQQGDVNGDVNAAPAAQYKTTPIDETVTIEGTNNLPAPKTDKTESIEVGGRYQVVDGEGTHEIEVLRDNGNGTLEVRVDGEQHTMPLDILQQMLGIGSGEVNGESAEPLPQQDVTDDNAGVNAPGQVPGNAGEEVNDNMNATDVAQNETTPTVEPGNAGAVSQSDQAPGATNDMVDVPAQAATVTPESMPMREVGTGKNRETEPDWLAVSPEIGHDWLFDVSGLDAADANEIVNNNLEAAQKAVEKTNKLKPRKTTNPFTLQAERERIANEQSAANNMLDYWKRVKAIEQDRQAQAAAERKAKDAEVAAQAQAEEAQRQAEELAKQQEQAERGAGAVHPAIAEKWGNAPKVEGYDNEITLANGEKIQGRYVMTESGAATPSHNALREFEKSEGFPVDENGNTVNDRDYERDKDAQNITRKMGDTYDSRAIQQVPVVSRDGVVLSGNGRTMAGELAASNNTDKAYIDHLKKYGKQFGFSPEQVSSMKHPRVVFVPDADMPYTTDTFAKFNEQEMKGQSKTEQAVKLGKVVDDATFNQIVRAINDHETLGDFYNNTRAATEAINALRRAGALNEMQYAEMFDGDAVSGTGRQIIENMLIGKAFEGNPDVIRQLTEIKSLRQSVVTALNEISTNKALGKDYSLENELAQAVDLAYKARKAGYKENEPVSPYATQLNLFPFEDGETVADYNNVAVLELADLMNDKRPTLLKKKLQDYNQQSAESAAGQMDIFAGGVKEKKEIIKTVLNTLHNGETEETSRPEQRDSVADERGGEASLQENGAADTGSAALATPQTEQSIDAAIVEAGKVTNTEPTDAQKEAGNYKKGHVKIDGFEISIEQPKGSVRSGVDDSGKPWSQTMNNTYGYIRGTEGVDGDHIDVFLSDNLDGWNGMVYVVDQVEKGGIFDEHKVMYGFNSEEDARKAYLSNYEDGWDGLGAITAVSKDEFKKWIDSSHRKTKPFAEYKNVKVGETQPIADEKDRQNSTLFNENTEKTLETAKKEWENLCKPKEIVNFANDEAAQEKWVTEHLDEIVDRYIAANGNKLDPDEVRRSFTGIGYTGKNVEEYRVQEGIVVGIIYDKMLENAVASGNISITLLTGVGGAGKSVATRKMKDELDKRGLVYDSAFNKYNKLEKAIKRAKELGMTDVQVIAVHNDALTAFGNTVNRGLQTGRFLALDYFLNDAFYNNQGKIAELQSKHPDVDIVCYDNSGNKGGDRPNGGRVSVEEATKWDYSVTDELLNNLLDIIENGLNERRFKPNEIAIIGRRLPDVARRIAQPSVHTTERIDRLGQRIRQEGVGDLRPEAPREQPVVRRDRLGATVDGRGEGGTGEVEPDAPLSLADLRETIKEEAPADEPAVETPDVEEIPNESTKVEPKSKKKTKSDYGSKNKGVSRDRYEELKKRMRKKLGGQMNMGVDPEILAIGTEMAAYHIEAGARKFADFAKRMIEDLGDVIKPYLKSFYNGARDLPEMSEWEPELTPYEEVRKFDVANFDKKSVDAMATAEHVIKEQEANKGAEAATAKIKETRNKKVAQQQPSLFDEVALSTPQTERKATESETNARNTQTPATKKATTEKTEQPKQDKDENVNLQAGTEEARGGGRQPEQNEPLGGGARHEAERPDGSRVGGRSESHPGDTSSRSGGISQPSNGRESNREPVSSPSPKKNTRNNHVERGKDYAPKDVDARIEANIAAIELMQKLIDSGKPATAKDMAVLRKFSGWGGLGKAFNESGYSYNPIARKLRQLLGDEGYEQAVMSRNSAYYTPAKVIDTLWDIAKAMGFKGGNVLEGSAGIGNILGLMPQELSERSNIHAVEIDSTSGNILSLLYPDAKVDVQGFEATKIPNGSVDLSITNVPFVTGLRVSDSTGDKDLSQKFHDIHDFCIAKNVRKLREGGIGIFITSSGTLDNSQKLRNWLVAEGNADVVGAFRLANNTFGGTGATSDIIVLRKRVNGQKSPHAIDVQRTTGVRNAVYKTGDTKKVGGKWVEETKPYTMEYNEYFVEHPEMMGGEMKFGFETGDNYRPGSKALYPKRGINQNDRLAKFVKDIAEKDWSSDVALPTQQTEQPKVYEELGENVKEGSMLIDKDGNLCVASYGRAVPLDVNNNKVKGRTKQQCFNDYSSIKDAVQAVLDYQTNNSDDAGLQPLIANLNKVYDNFVNTYGHFHKNPAISFLRNDMDFSSVAALETMKESNDANGKRVQSFTKGDIFSKRVVEPETEPKPTNVKDGIITSIYKHGRIDIPYISEQLGKTPEAVKQEIINSGLGFENPLSREVEVSYEYLSGNVREKLRQAQEANDNGEYDKNIKALEKKVPMNIPAHLIEFSLGSSWLDPKVYEQYIKDRTDLDIPVRNVGGTWIINEPYYTAKEKNRAMGVTSEKLDKTIMGHELIAAAMQNKTVRVAKTTKLRNGSTETIVDQEAIQACAAKIDEIRQDFKDWAREKMQSDLDLSQQVEEAYNEQFNNYVPKEIPDEFVPEFFSGATHNIHLRTHQAKAAIRATTQPLMLAHEVGSGKSFTLITTAMEMRRLGTARKPMVVVQNATLAQFVADAKLLYPNAKILSLEEKDRKAEGRKAFYAKIKYNDWDMIVIPQSTFEMIPDSEERQMAFVKDKIQEKMQVLEQLQEAGADNFDIKRAEKEISKLEDDLALISSAKATKRKEKDAKKAAVAKQNAEVKALEMLDRRVDDVEDFDEMGIDALLVDEAHEYKHLGFATAMQRGVKGVDPSYSKKAQGVYLKTQSVKERTGGKNVVFATGTPISNTAAEVWTFMRYLMPADVMKSYDIYYFDDFVRNFGNLTQMLEFTTSGKFKENNRFAGYVNLPELVRLWFSVADTVRSSDVGSLMAKIPEMSTGKAQDIYLPQTPALRSVMKYVKARLNEYDNMSGKEKKANSHIPLTMYGIAKAAAVDARLVMNDAPDDPNSKTNEAVRQTLKSLKATDSYKGTVAIFADNFQNKESGFNIFENIRDKLIDEGVPANQVVVIKSGMNINKKQEIFDKVNAGEVRVIMGSTFTLGTGVNIQERLHTLIHLDAPNRPMDYTQRNGRILRQGNLHKEWGLPVSVLRFGVEDSLDVTAYQRLKTKGAIVESIMNGKQLIGNSMENRTMEEEEDVFGDTVAQLSGSEYALLKQQAERDVRKYTAKKKQHEADQVYIHNQKPRLEGQIAAAKSRMEQAKKSLELVKDVPENPVITVNKVQYPSVDAMGEYIKAYNKKVTEAADRVRNSYMDSSEKRDLTMNIGGFEFEVTTVITKDTERNGTTLSYVARRVMTYKCDALGIDGVPVKQALLRNAIEDIVTNVLTGKDFKERIESSERTIANNENELKQIKSREGKPFEFDKELAEAEERLADYEEKMKAELEAKEAKYAEMDADIDEAQNVSFTDEEDNSVVGEDAVGYGEVNERSSSYRNSNGDVIQFEGHAEQLSLFNGGDVAMTSQRTERATERAKRVKEMSDAELLKEMQRDIAEFEKLGRGDWGIQTACTDEYDRRHIKDYNAECERVRTMLDENNVSIEEAEDMLCNAIYSWRDGYATADRSKLLAQFDTLNDYYAELEERGTRNEERDEDEAAAMQQPTEQTADEAGILPPAPSTLEGEKSQKPKRAGGFNPTEIKLRKLKSGESCYVERRYQESGGFDFTGSEKVESDADLAYIFRNLENSAIENTFLVLIKNGKATILHTGMGSYAASVGHVGAGLLAASKLKPDHVIFVHNHPSGRLEPSVQDVAMQTRAKKMFGEGVVREAIIIDITSGEYCTFDDGPYNDDVQVKKRPTEVENEIPYKTYSFSQYVFDKDYKPGTTMKITDTNEAAAFISSHRLGERDKLSLIVINRAGHVTGNVFLPWTNLDDVDITKAANKIAAYIHQMGGENGIIYGSGTIDRSKLGALSREIENHEVRLADFINVEGVSAQVQGVLEDEVLYEAVPRNTEQRPTEVAEDGEGYGEVDDSGISDEDLAGYDAGRYSFAESITQGLVDLATKNANDQQLRMNAMREFGGNLRKLQRLMSKQRAYDKATVDDIVRLTRMVMGNGFFKDMRASEVKRLLAAIKKGVGVEDLTPIANNVVDMLVQHQLRESKAMLHKLMQVRGRKVDARGVEVQAGLDIDGQRMMSALKDGMSLGENGLSTRINDCENRLDSKDETIKKNAVSEYQGLMLAKEYHDNILSGEEEEIILKDEKRQEEEKIYDFRREPVLDKDGNAIMNLDGSVRTVERKTLKPEFKNNVTDENKQLRRNTEAAIERIEQSIRESRMERVTAYSDFMSDVAGDVRASRERAAAWRAEQLKRVDEIHHNANSDLQDIDPKSQTREKKFVPLFNPKNDLVRGLFMPLATFEKFMRFFGRRFHNGEGYLFDRYVRGMIDCEDKEWRSKRAAHEELDAKVTELFGKTKLGAKRHWSDLFELERKKKYPTIPVEYWDNGERVQETLSQGEALSLVVWSKQKDAEAGLRRMGISEEDIETIKNNLDPKFLQLAEWVVEEFLPKRREYYNEVHERMFGAPMAAIEHYFPIVRNSRDVEKPTDVAERDQKSTNASTITGSFIKRVRTAAALDIHTDFFDLLLKHLDDMEHIAAWAEFNRDLNTLRNYKRFKNRVSNMNSFEFGAGKDLWKAFDNCCAIVTGVYEGNAKSKLDKITLNINKGFTRGAIAFRINTALKQYLSLPAFWSDARIDDLVKYQTPIGNAMVWGWAMENVPGLSKRWQSRQVGDTRLMDTDLDWKLWRNKYMKYLERGGMWSNALVDSATCASGAKAVYETKKRRYLKIGYTEEQAEKKALQDAAIAYKGSQQESMGGFVSEMQVDRTFLNNMLTVFRNSPFSYGRKMTTGLRELKKRLRPGYKSDFIEAEATKMVREGIPEENAKKEARRLYRFGGLHALFDVFNYGYLLSFLWTVLGGSAWYLLFGKDDEEKEEIIKDGARRLWFSPLEGFTGGNTLSEKGGLLLKYAFDEDGADKALNDFVNWSWFTTPMQGEYDNLMRDIRVDTSKAWWDVLSLAVQCNLGFKPETFTDGLAAIADYCDGDPQTTKEALLCWMRVMQVPQSQVDKIYFDELGLTARDAQMLNAMSMADRYSRYKMRKNNPLSYIMHSETDEKVFEKYRKRFLDNMQERMERLDDEQLGWNFENPNDSERRKAVGKVYAKGKGVQDSAGKKPASNWKPETRRSQLKYQRLRDYNDLAEDVLLDVAIDQAKNRGDGETEKALRDAKKELTEIKRGKHTKKINRPGLGEGSADDDKAIMEKLRARRKEILREYGIIQ